MSDSSMAEFIEYLNTNPDVRNQVEELERSIAYSIRQEDEMLAAIAVDAGFDVATWNGRAAALAQPALEAAAPLCCGILTSDITLLTQVLETQSE